MQINGSLPVLSSATDLGSAGLQADQRKIAPAEGEPTQTQSAVRPSDEAEGAAGDDTAAAKRQGRGLILDVKI